MSYSPWSCKELDVTERLWASLVAQMVKNLPARFDPWVRKIPRRREWLPTPVFLPGESHGQRSLAGYSPWGCTKSDRTERLTLFFHELKMYWHCPGTPFHGNDSPSTRDWKGFHLALILSGSLSVSSGPQLAWPSWRTCRGRRWPPASSQSCGCLEATRTKLRIN